MCFQDFFSSINFQNINSNCSRMLHYAPLVSIDSHHSQLPKRHFEQRQNAPLCVLDFKFTHVSICNLETLISTLSLEQDMAEMHTISDFKKQITNTHTNYCICTCMR